jgi:hypothetical protein
MSKVIDVAETVTRIDGEDMMQEAMNGKGEEPLTLRSVLINALLHPSNEDEKTKGETKLARWELAKSLYASPGPVAIANSDISMLKSLVNKVFTSLVVGQVYEMLDRKKAPGEPEETTDE